MPDATRPHPHPPLLAHLVVVTGPWTCPLSGDADAPVAFVVGSRRHPGTPPLVFSAAAVQRTLHQGLAEIAAALGHPPDRPR